ncbi:MAG: hypothetical protein ABWZ25_11685 [Chitinophagaceae bacterium]
MTSQPSPHTRFSSKYVEDLNDYVDFLNLLAYNDEDKVFYNSGPFHAAAVMGTMFNNAKYNVQVFSGGFTGEVSDKEIYLSGLKGFLDRPGVKLDVIIQDKSRIKKGRIFQIFREYPSKVTLHFTDAKMRYSPSSDDDINPSPEQFLHFCIADQKMYRLETDIKNYRAECNFNDPNMAGILKNIFQQALSHNSTEEISVTNS